MNTEEILNQAISYLNNHVHDRTLVYQLTIREPKPHQSIKGYLYGQIELYNNKDNIMVALEDVSAEKHLYEEALEHAKIRFSKKILIAGIMKCDETHPKRREA